MAILLGLGGDALSAPQDTIVAYWSALAAGAQGLAVSVQEREGKLVCAPPLLGALPLDQVDAGEQFKPGSARDDGGVHLVDVPSPWGHPIGRRPARYPLLDDVLRVFGRRTLLLLRLVADVTPDLRDRVSNLLHELGLASRVSVELPLEHLPEQNAKGPISWLARLDAAHPSWEEARKRGAGGLVFCHGDRLAWQSARKEGLAIWLMPAPGRLAFPSSLLKELRDTGSDPITLMCGAVLPALEVLRPQGVVFRDSLEGKSLDTGRWAAGYSQKNGDTELRSTSAGFGIRIQKGEQYSGGGLVTRMGFTGDFDVTVGFSVSNPTQGTTFELAAIGIDPPFISWQVGSSVRAEPNLVFDVHGAPPYASSERDENDGYRFGWNNASNLIRIGADWSHASGNMFNQYARDVGDASKPGSGRLRLVRHGAMFASYYADDATGGCWVCSGAANVATMPAEVFLRLAAKHWHKGDLQILPENEVTFRFFEVRQP